MISEFSGNLPNSIKTTSVKMTGFRRSVFLCIIIVIIGFADVEANPREHRVKRANAEIEEYPWQARLHRSDSEWIASATIISPQLVLTLATTVYPYVQMNKLNDLSISLGKSVLADVEGEYKIQSVVVHPEYTWDDDTRGNLAVLKMDVTSIQGGAHIYILFSVYPVDKAQILTECAELTTEIDFNGTIGAVQLPAANVPVGTPVTLTGWSESYHLEKYDVKIGDNAACNTLIDNYRTGEECTTSRHFLSNVECNLVRRVNDDSICTVKLNDSPGECVRDQGNYGSPLVHNNVLVGVQSWRITCPQGYPIVYTDVYKYIDWIQDVIANC